MSLGWDDSERKRQALERVRCAECEDATRRSELDQRWSWAGAIKLVSYVVVAILSGFVWYGAIVAAMAVLRWLGVNV